MGKTLTWWILGALVLGLVVGFAANSAASPETVKELVYYLGIVTDLFLRLIKMIIAPLVFAALVSGIGHMGGDAKALGRIGGRALGWFIGASFISITIGIFAVNLLQPGVGLELPLPPVDASSGVATVGFDLKKFVTHLVPKSIFEALATNEILQIVIFSLFAGVALAKMGEKGAPILKAADAIMHLMLIVTGFVMRFAPLAVFAAVTATIAERGLGVLITYGAFMGGFYVALALLMLTILFAGGLVIGMKNAGRLALEIRDPIVLAFTTASSEAAYPRTLEALERFGVPPKIASFVLPLGYSFNLDGSMMYCSFATIFIAQAYGIDLTIAQEVAMLLILMVTSKGMAGVPRASLVVIAATLGQFNIPEAGLILILAVDHFLDMGRSASNVVGNAVATAVVAEWEKKREPTESAA
ncbi:MAG: dicarboxylate/amino acid:cation symporter [Sphingomonas sp.]|nr:MAG: dicarboxylate/amino acid:cation symporter [Sphingomonas sp.]